MRFLLFFTIYLLVSVVSFAQTVITAGPDTTICLGGTADLKGTVVSGSYGTTSYTFETFNYTPELFSGGFPIQFGSNQDDQIAGPFNIGFDFCFFNQIYTQFYIGSNGWVGFSYDAAWTTFTAQPIPTTNAPVPKNCIMAPWQDWWPGWTPGGTTGTNVYYYVTGGAPNRKLVVYWLDCPLYNCTGDPLKKGTFQIVLNEQNSIVENHIAKKPNCSNSENATQGVHNSDGTVAFTAVGRNCTPWTTSNESTRFVPSGIRWYTGGYPGGTIVGYGENLSISPTVTTTYTVAVESCAGGTAVDSVTVFVVDATFSYSSPSYCSSDPNPVPTLLQNGGTFTASPAGLVFISTVTGEIDVVNSLPGTYLVTRTINTPCSVSYSQTVSVAPTPLVPVAVDDTVNRCGPGQVILSVVPNPGEQYAWYDAPTGGTKIFVGPVFTVNLAAGTTYYVESQTLASSCKSLSRTPVVAIIKPVPNITNNVTLFSQCSGITTNIALTADQPGTGFSWTAAAGSGNITGFTNGSGTLISDNLVNTGPLTGSVIYTVTPSLNGCNGIPVAFTVTVYPVPDLTNTPLLKGICQGQNTNILLTSNVTGTLFTWTCTQTSGNITGYSANPGPPASAINQVLNLNTFVKDSLIYHISPGANGCNGPVYDFKVIVNPVPSIITTPMVDTICSEATTNIHLIATCAGTSFIWTAALGTGNITGFANGSGDWIIQTLTNTLSSPGSVIYTITPSTSTCTGNPAVFSQFVKPTPHVTNTPLTSSNCNNTLFNLNLTSEIPGALFTWTCTPSSGSITGWADNPLPATAVNQTLVNAGNAIESVTYHITPTAGGCNGPVTDYVVTVYPTATMSNIPASQSQCDNLNTNITLTSNVAGTLFTWTCTPSSANITGWADNAVPGSVLNQVLDNTGSSTEWVTYQVLPTANGCTGIPANFLVTVYPTPDLTNAPASKSQCDNLPTGITLTSNVAGTLFTWSCTTSSANITGWTNNAVPTTVLNQVLDNTGFNTEWVTYNITPAANGCPGNITPYIVTVFPTPNLSNAPPAMQICNNTSTNLTLTSNVAGTLFTWTCTPSSANIAGYSANAVPATLLDQLLTNLGLNTEWVTYHTTPAANGCTGPVTDYTVTVVQSPDVFFNPPAQTICSAQTSNINVLSSVPGATFTWTATPSSPNLTGQSAGSGNVIAQSVTNSGNTVEGVTYLVTPAAFGCPPGSSQNIVLTVDPSPVVNNVITNFQICSASATSIIPVSTVPGSSYSWSASGSSPNVTGFSNGAGPSIVQILTNTGFNLESVTYQVTATANGCTGIATPFTVTVFPVANVTFNPNGQSLCSGAATSINLGSSVAGTSFTWTASGSGPSISGYAPGSGNIIQQTLTNSGPFPGTATFLVAPAANGCPGVSASVIVTVNPLPAVTLTPCFDPVVSVLSQPIPLKGNVPFGGTWSGTGVNAGTFFPGFAGPGNHVINYSYTNTWGCVAGANVSITVVALAPFACGTSLTDVRDNQVYPTVQVGTQCWMATNLNYGTVIPSPEMQRDNCVFEKYCFGDATANCASAGGMYQWDELMNYTTSTGSQGFCPPEWHIPTEADWNTLFNVYISNGFAGSPLKFTGFSGFNAFLSGTRFDDVQWDFSNFAVMFWSSNSHSPRKAWAHGMNSFNPSVSYYPSHRNNAFFVRCIKD